MKINHARWAPLGLALAAAFLVSGVLSDALLSNAAAGGNDRYGGSVANRIRFFVEAVEAMATVDGPGRVGFRIMPGNPFNDLHDDDPDETFTALLEALDPLGLAYCHVLRMDGRDNEALVRRHFSGPVILNDSYSAAEADAAIDAGRGDAVSFGRLYITNPDLAERFEAGAELASTDSANIYEPGPEGYIDFPRAPGAN